MGYSAMRCSTMARWSVVLLLLCSMPVFAQAPWQGLLSPSRATDWRGVGATIPTGTIPDCATQPATPVTIATINAAITADIGGPSYCKIDIPAGTYTATTDSNNGMINLTYAGQANIVLNGAGPNQTFFVWSGATTGAGRCNYGPSSHVDLCVYNGLYYTNGGETASFGKTAYGAYQGNITQITGGLTQGSTQITLASITDPNNPTPTPLKVGEEIQIEQLDPATDNGNAWFCATDASTTPTPCSQQGAAQSPWPTQGPSTQTQLFVVTACGATTPGATCTSPTITLNTPIRAPNWSLSDTPQAAWQGAMPISNVGIQNISLDASSAQDQPIVVSCAQCSNVWFSNIRTVGGTTTGAAPTNHFLIWQSNHVTVENSYMYGSNPAANGYGIDWASGTSDSLAINNISQHIASAYINETGVGSVFAYNYAVDAYFGSNWQSCTEFEHGGGDNELLYEGNVGICHSADDIHGNHAFNTLYRNYLSGFDPSTTGGPRQLDTFAYFDMYGSRYYNLVGNVLGTAGTTVNYQNVGQAGLLSTADPCPSFPEFAVYSLNFSDQNQEPYASPCYSPTYGATIDNDALVSGSLMRWANYDVVNGSVQENASETASTAPVYPGLASPATTFPASFFLSAQPSWWVFPNGNAAPWPGIGPDVTSGNIAGTAGHAWLNPAANCYINVMGGTDGSNGESNVMLFDPVACYSSSTITQVATPTFNPAAGTYTTPKSVTISDTTAGATIYYTTDGSTPTTNSPVYTSPITVSANETLQAIATAPGNLQSAVGSANYVISLPTVATPTFTPAAGTYSSAQSVTISVSSPGATIHYTTDGSTPTANSPLYEAPIAVTSSMTLQAVATAEDYVPSALGTAAYTISSASPTITYVQGAQLPYPSGLSYTPCYFPGTSGSMCQPMTLASPTAAGDLLVVVASNTGYQGSQTNIQSIACADGSGNAVACNWVLPGAACQNFNSNGGGGVDCAYILSTPAGIASVTVTMSGTTKYGTAYLREYRSTEPTGFRFDSLATAVSNNCDSCATPSLTLSGTNDVLIALGAPGNEFTAIAAPYGDMQTEPNQTGSIIGDVLNTSSGAGATVSGNGANGPASLLTLAFTDTPPPPAAAATPTFSPAAGTYTGWQNVKITSTTTGATIYYTADGSSPTTNSPVYSRPLNVSASQTLQAIAVASSSSPSTVASAAYTINIAPPPTFSPAAGPYSSGQIVTISDSNPNATIYYTTDGSTPTTGSTPYGTPFLVPSQSTSSPATVNVQAIATASGYGTSPVSSAVYTIGGTGTISLIQQSVLTNNGQQITCSPMCPAFSINPTGAGDLLFVAAVGTGDGHNNQSNISSITCANASGPASCGTWVQPGTAVCQSWNSKGGGVDCGYILSSAPGITSVTVTMSTYTPYGTVYFREYHTTEPTGFRFDAGTTAFNSTGCGSCTTPDLTLSDANDVVIATGAPQNGFTGINAPYGDVETEGFTLSAIGDVLNTSSGAGATLTGNGTSSNEATLLSIAFTDTPPVTATPTILPAAGTYTSTQSVTISDSTPGATIYYTTDGSTPSTSSAAYSGAITVSASETISAIAMARGSAASGVASATYTINLQPAATPTFTPAAGTYTSAQSVTIGDATAGATIYYTTDGSTPTTSSSVYSSPITVSASETLKAIATASGYLQSTAGSAAYTINLAAAATPTFSPAAGTYTGTQSVTISDATSGATIYFTIDGSTPTTSSHVYSSPIVVSASETIKAIAIAGGYTNSAVASASYSISSPIPVPVINSLSPAMAVAGGSAFSLTVNGSGFTSNSAIHWGGMALTTQFSSASQLTAQIAANAIATAGITAITVQTPALGGGTSSAYNFEVDSASSAAAPMFATTTATVTAGSSVVYSVTLPSNVTEAYVNCLNLPAGAQCSYSSTNGAVTIGTTSATPPGTYQVTVVFTEAVTGTSTAFVLLPLLLLPAYRVRNKLKHGARWMIVGLVAILFAGALISGCGGGSKSGATTNTATSSGVVTLTVQ